MSAHIILELSPEKWIDLLKIYGPMALFIFMVYVLLGRARATAQDEAERKVQRAAYSAVWTSIFILAGIIVVVYWKTNFPSEYIASGTITNLRYPQTISTEQSLFLHRRTVGGKRFEYEWRAITSAKGGEQVELLLQNDPSDTSVLTYDFPISKDFYSGFTEIAFDQNSKQMIVHLPTKQNITLTPVLDNAKSNGIRAKASGIVYAAELPQISADELLRALDTDDPLIRRSARKDLISLGLRAIPQLSTAITGVQTSRRLRIGAMATLGDMIPAFASSVSEDVRCAVRQFSTVQDAELRAAASHLIVEGLKAQSDCNPVTQLPVGSFKKAKWHPLDMSAGNGSGLFVLDSNGVGSILTPGPNGLALRAVGNSNIYNPAGYIAASEKYVFIVVDSLVGCAITRYSITGDVPETISIPARKGGNGERCGGLAAVGDSLYVLVASEGYIGYWPNWKSTLQHIYWEPDSDSGSTSMVFDKGNHSLLISEANGSLYATALDDVGKPTGFKRLFQNTHSAGNSVAVADAAYLLAAGKHISAVSKQTGKISDLKIPGVLPAQGTIVGLAVDQDNRLWFVDDSGMIRGPIKL